MRKYPIIILSLIAAFLTFTGLSIQKTSGEKTKLDINAISNIEILKAYRTTDTVCVWKRLNKEQMKSFVDKWNGPADKEQRKFATNYRIAVYLKNSSIREFRANGQFIKEKGDWCFDFKDKSYFDKLYSEAVVKDSH